MTSIKLHRILVTCHESTILECMSHMITNANIRLSYGITITYFMGKMAKYVNGRVDCGMRYENAIKV